MGLRYNVIAREPTPREHLRTQQIEPKEEFNIILASGKRSVKNTDTMNEHMVSLVNLSFEYLKPAGQKFKYGVGVDIGIDENRNIIVDGNDVELASTRNQVFSTVSAIGQFRASRLAVQAGIGYELFNNNKLYFSNDIYQRLGLRFYLHKNAFAGIAIKATGFNKADYIEWSLGYSISK